MYETNYHRASSVDDAVALFGKGKEAKFLAGGQTLLPVMKQRLASPSDVIDLSKLKDMIGIEPTNAGILIKGATTHYDVATSAIVQKAIPALASLASQIGDPAVRYRGTIGGSLANNDPAADYPAAVLGLGAKVVTDRREIAADDFFLSLYETALEPGEIVTRVVFPIPQPAAYAKFRSAASRFAIAGVFIARTGEGVRVAVTGAGASGVFRARELESALNEEFRADALDGLSIDPSGLLEDMNATPEYRAHLTMVMARCAMQNPGRALSFK
jgi:carbon-monoxide dehydrogenase medium subunit